MHDAASWLLGGAVSLLGLFGAVTRFGRRIFLAGLLVPLAAVWVISQRRPVYVDRYFIVLIPFVIALVVLGVGEVRKGLSRAAGTRSSGLAIAGLGIVAVLGAGLSVHLAPKFAKEDWRGLAGYLRSEDALSAQLLLSEPEVALPLSLYLDPSLLDSPPSLIPACEQDCWWVIRQPYTATHALTTSLGEPGRWEPPQLPQACSVAGEWESSGNLLAWGLTCSR